MSGRTLPLVVLVLLIASTGAGIVRRHKDDRRLQDYRLCPRRRGEDGTIQVFADLGESSTEKVATLRAEVQELREANARLQDQVQQALSGQAVHAMPAGTGLQGIDQQERITALELQNADLQARLAALEQTAGADLSTTGQPAG